MDIWNQFFSFFTYDPDQPMLIQTAGFFFTFSFFYFIYALLSPPRIQYRNNLLLLFSLFFYYKLSGWFVLMLIGLALSDFLLGRASSRTKSSKSKDLYLFISVVLNVGLLIYYKYTNFFIEIFNDFSSSTPIEPISILQPIGISYFVFKSLSYSIDIHREMIDEPEKDFANYLLYVSFFPNILAGPITKARDLLPQFHKSIPLTSVIVGEAVFMISVGLIKKILVADYLAANLTDRLFESPQYFSSLELWIGSFAGLFRLYFDFSGYTDMVVGISLLMGYPIKGNFNQPFKAENITAFWKRWHITLYDWLNEYVYQPVAFQLRSLKMAGIMISVFATFFISGVWHGANITFVLWGLLHGVAICLEILTSSIRKKLSVKGGKVYSIISVCLTVLFLALTSVIINSSDLPAALSYWEKMFSGADLTLLADWFLIYKWPAIVMIVAVILQYLPVAFYSRLAHSVSSVAPWKLGFGFATLIWLLYQLAGAEAISFIYIEF